MPNWCDVDLIIAKENGDEEKFNKLRADIEKIYDEDSLFCKEVQEKVLNSPCSFKANEWLGNIPLYFRGYLDVGDKIYLWDGESIKVEQAGKSNYRNEHQTTSCRGSIYFLDTDDSDIIQIRYSGAWDVQDIPEILSNEVAKDFRVEYVAEEPGCELYINTDVAGNFFCDKYIYYNGQYDSCYGENLSDITKAVLADIETNYQGEVSITLETLNQMDYKTLAEFVDTNLEDSRLYEYTKE